MTLLSIDEAKKAFKDVDCSTFSMARENLPLYEKYLELGISKETELDWKKERFYEILNSSNQYSNWKKINKLYDLAQSIKQIDFYHEIISEIDKIQSDLADNEQVIIAETLIGRLSISERSGLIFETFDLGDKQLSSKFSELATGLLHIDTKDAELEIRVDNAKNKLADVVKNL